METKKIEQKGFVGSFKFGKHFYALVLGLALVLFGGLYFLVNAENLEIETNLTNAYQTIGRVEVTSDGTTDGETFFDFNFDGDGGALFNKVPGGSILKKLGLNSSNELVYEIGGTLDDGDWTIDGDSLYRLTGNISIGTNTYPGGKLNIISSDVGLPELYIGQSQDTAANISFENTKDNKRWSLGYQNNVGSGTFYIGQSGQAYSFFVDGYSNLGLRGNAINIYGNTVITGGNLNMSSFDINDVNIVTAVAFVMSSDKDLKKNIEKIKSPLDKIYALNGYTFDWKKNGQSDLGLIAQEVEKVLPELVHIDTNGHKGVQYANMVALLIEGVKELGNKINNIYDKYLDQQSKIDNLEERIKNLEAKLK